MNTRATAADLGYKNRSNALRRLLMAASSAGLMALSLPNEVFKYGFPPLGFIALVPLWAALLETESYGAAAGIAAVFGSLQHAM